MAKKDKEQKDHAHLKLGSGRTAYYNPVTQLDIANSQVRKVPSNILNHKDTREALKNGHLVRASVDEFDDHVEGLTAGEKEARAEELGMKKPEPVDTKKKAPAPVEDDEDEDDEEDEDEEDQDEDDEEDEPSKSDMIDAIKESPVIKPEEKKNLAKASVEVLRNLYELTKKK